MHTKRKEAFKYTSLTRIEGQTYLRLRNPSLEKKLNIKPLFSDSNARLVFVDGFFREEESCLPSTSGVTCFSKATSSDSTTLEKFTHDYVSSLPFLNTDVAHEGYTIEVAAGVDAGIIEVVFYTTAHSERTLIQPRNTIRCSPGSRVTVIEHYIGEAGAESLTNTVTHVQLEKNAQAHHIKLQTESLLSDHIGQVFVEQDEESVFTSHLLSFGGHLSRNEIHSLLAEKNANVHLYGIYLPQKNQHMDQYTVIDHAHSHCNSEELYRGIMLENGRGVFNGKVIVRPDAQKTSAKQTNNNLLLSAAAEIDTKPELQIFADDVQCSHGATVGQLDKHSLFYLQSRGLPLAQAKSLLLYAFAAELFQTIPDLALRKLLEKVLFDYLPEAAWLEEFSGD